MTLVMTNNIDNMTMLMLSLIITITMKLSTAPDTTLPSQGRLHETEEENEKIDYDCKENDIYRHQAVGA